MIAPPLIRLIARAHRGARLRILALATLKSMYDETHALCERAAHKAVAQEIARRDPRNRRAMPRIF